MLAPLVAWESFYIIVGSSAGALTGLQFVVIALVAESERRSSRREISAFGTPTVMHFSAVLLIAAILSAPWDALASVAVTIGMLGISGIVYVAVVIRRAQVQTGYEPEWEDWLWHAILPFLGYAGFLTGALFVAGAPGKGLFIVSAASLLLLFVGIHNAWDAVTFIALQRLEGARKSEE